MPSLGTTAEVPLSKAHSPLTAAAELQVWSRTTSIDAQKKFWQFLLKYLIFTKLTPTSKLTIKHTNSPDSR